MSTRQTIILGALRSGPMTAYSLAALVNAPDASVRRDIQAIRRAGFFISDARDFQGLYRLG